MNKAELVDAIAVEADVTKAVAQKLLDAVTKVVANTLEKGEQITLVGFGNFLVKERKARKGRNPSTNEVIDIPAAKIPAFKPSKVLKDAVNSN